MECSRLSVALTLTLRCAVDTFESRDSCCRAAIVLMCTRAVYPFRVTATRRSAPVPGPMFSRYRVQRALSLYYCILLYSKLQINIVLYKIKSVCISSWYIIAFVICKRPLSPPWISLVFCPIKLSDELFRAMEVRLFQRKGWNNLYKICIKIDFRFDRYPFVSV